jgi:hypothetical protein
VPCFKLKNLGIKFKNVVFPDPLIPTKPTFFPPSIFADKFFKACVPSGYVKLIFLNSNVAFFNFKEGAFSSLKISFF